VIPRAIEASFACDIDGFASVVEEEDAVVAANAALVLLRRFAKVGPEATFSEIETKCRQIEAANFVNASRPVDVAAEDAVVSVQVAKETVPCAIASEASTQVCFDFRRTTIHEITPYAEIYGLHPREFVFDRHFHMLPSADTHGFVGFADTDDDSKDSESEDVDDDARSWVRIC